MKKWMRLLQMVMLVGIAAGCGEEDEYDVYYFAASGRAIPEAAAYKTQNPSLMILVSWTEVGEGQWNYSAAVANWQAVIPANWVASDVRELELVCYLEGETFEVVEEANYARSGSPIVVPLERRRRLQPVVLKEARTGTVVAQTTLRGGDPRPFNQEESGDVYGGLPNPDELPGWLVQHIEW